MSLNLLLIFLLCKKRRKKLLFLYFYNCKLFFCYTCRIGLSDKNSKKCVQMNCTAYIVYTIHLPLHHVDFGQFKAIQVLYYSFLSNSNAKSLSCCFTLAAIYKFVKFSTEWHFNLMKFLSGKNAFDIEYTKYKVSSNELYWHFCQFNFLQ